MDPDEIILQGFIVEKEGIDLSDNVIALVIHEWRMKISIKNFLNVVMAFLLHLTYKLKVLWPLLFYSESMLCLITILIHSCVKLNVE